MSTLTGTQKLKQIRDGFPLEEGKIYMNIGSMGPLAAAGRLAILEEAGSSEGNGRSASSFKHAAELRNRVKQEVSQLIHADPGEIALTTSTTHGIHLTLQSLDWQEGDEIVTSTAEHFAVILPLQQLRERFGVCIRYFDIKEGQSSDFENRITPKTKLLALSHVSYSTGEVLPVREYARIARKHGVPVLVDGAQSAGAIPIDVKNLDVDYYSLPGQKWLYGPQGTGALYVRREIVDSFHPAVNQTAFPQPYELLKLHTDIRRYEAAPPGTILLAGFGAALGWLLNSVGQDEAYRGIAENCRYVHAGFDTIPGVHVVTPPDAAGLISFYTEFADTKTLLDHLNAHGIFARSIEPFGYARVSVSFFHTEEELDTLIKAVRELATEHYR